MYYSDLSIIPNTMHRSALSGKAVGWLSYEYSYPQGKASANFLERLSIFCCAPMALYFGYHFCEFCNGPEGLDLWNWRKTTEEHKSDSIPFLQDGGKRYSLGSGDIIVFGLKEIYLAPNLIYHYVSDHDYSPQPSLSKPCFPVLYLTRQSILPASWSIIMGYHSTSKKAHHLP